MSKMSKILFAVFNIVLLSSTYSLVAWFPTGLLFGWIPFQLFFFYASIVVAAMVWGLYYNCFFNRQKHVDEKYGDQ